MRINARRSKLAGTALLLALAAANVGAARMADSTPNPCGTEEAGKWVSVDGGCKDLQSGLVWSGTLRLADGNYPTFPQAQQICADYSVEGGYADWRQPTRAEMKTAVTNAIGAHVDLNPWAPPNSSHFSGTMVGTNFVYTVNLATGSDFKALIYDRHRGTYTAVGAVCVR